MTNVLAFDFGASSGRVLLGSFDNERISYKEVHRFENIPIREDGRLVWDFYAILEEIKKTVDRPGPCVGSQLDLTVDAAAFQKRDLFLYAAFLRTSVDKRFKYVSPTAMAIKVINLVRFCLKAG